MNALDRRDRRRALSIWLRLDGGSEEKDTKRIAAALKREREEAVAASEWLCPCRLCVGMRGAK